MTKIVRTPTRAEGGITEAERAHMAQIAEKWIGVAMRTDPINPEKIGPAVRRLYAAAGLECKRVIIVPSPLVMAFAYGAAAWVWHCRKEDLARSGEATSEATFAATYEATDAATREATFAATFAATYEATDAATREATFAATYEATFGATFAATDAATRAATRAATDAATFAATSEATYEATSEATSAATGAATDAATFAATSEATREATFGATSAATDAATRAATRAATDAATFAATSAATDTPEKGAAAACFEIAGHGGLQCARRWYHLYQGGNMWAGASSFYEAARDVLGLDLPVYEAYQAWEDCAREGGFRVMHEEFCMVSDFPAQIHKDDQHRPHNDSGPSHEWRDGWKLWYINGVHVTEQIVMHPETLTPAQIGAEENAEVRRVMIERFGSERYLLESGSTPVQRDDFGVLYRRDVPGDEPIVMVRLLNSTPEPDGALCRQEAEEVFGADAVQRRLDTMRAIGHPVDSEVRFKAYMLRVPPTVRTAHEAVAWTFGKDATAYAPQIES